MKDIVAHCNKSIVKTEDNIKDTKRYLKDITESEEYQRLQKTIKNNEANTKHLLQQRKFNYLKYKQNSTTKETPQPTKHKSGFRKIYASVVQRNLSFYIGVSVVFNNTNTNVSTTEKFSNRNAENESQTLFNKPKTLNPTNDRKAVENHHLEALPKQDKNQVQGTKKSKI